jgi:hypothetical protein
MGTITKRFAIVLLLLGSLAVSGCGDDGWGCGWGWDDGGFLDGGDD